jgi:hypothetical protein
LKKGGNSLTCESHYSKYAPGWGSRASITRRRRIMMKGNVVITFSQEELRTLNEIVQDADGKRAMEYLTRLDKRSDAFLEPK